MNETTPAGLGAGQGRSFRTIVIKVHSRCNLSCDYCYLYAMADQTWRNDPYVITPVVIDKIVERLAEHVRTHRQPNLEIALHGGEPLLAGKEILGVLTDRIRAEIGHLTALTFCMQTNGVLLDEPMLDFLCARDIAVGVSLDGDKQANDRHRLTHQEGSTYEAVHRGLTLLSRPPYRRIFAGILAVIDLRNNPRRVAHSLLEFNPPQIDFLLPHGNWDNPPPGYENGPLTTPYADWLSKLLGYADIRTFDVIARLLNGSSRGSEFLGQGQVPLVIGVGGEIERVDTMRSAFNGAAQTELNVFDHSLDMATLDPHIMRRMMGETGLCQTCRLCPIRRECGGGYYPHRYREANGFNNPSVYCGDLLKLYWHVARFMNVRFGPIN